MFPFCILFFRRPSFYLLRFCARRSETAFFIYVGLCVIQRRPLWQRVAEISRERCLPILRYQSVIARVTGMLFACEAIKTIENSRKKCAATVFPGPRRRVRVRFHLPLRARLLPSNSSAYCTRSNGSHMSIIDQLLRDSSAICSFNCRSVHVQCFRFSFASSFFA